MNRHQLVEYYSNEHVISEILKAAKDREVAGAFWDGRYDQRPNIVQYPSDIVQMVKKGITSFHLSVEHWSNPMAITNDNYDKIRTGWDMIIDIDSKLGLDESKIAAQHICKLLKSYGIKNFGIKFSGRRGFHISLPSVMFPKEIDYKPLAKKYPETPRIIANFIREKIKDELLAELVKQKGMKKLTATLDEVPSEVNPYMFVEVEKDWGNRHMFRAPYSFNEKTWLVSVPLKLTDLKNFKKEDAESTKVLSKKHPDFFSGEADEAAELLTDAIDWNVLQKKKEVKTKKKLVKFERKVPEEHFPPCIKNILNGLPDGRKRSTFTLANFLRAMKWTSEEIEDKITEWNQKNKQPLPSSFLLGQIRWAERNQRTSANCFNDQFYVSIGICKPDPTCNRMNAKKTSNPMAYPMRKIPKKRKFRGFSCGVCNKEFKTSKSLQLHKSKTH